MPEIPEFVRYPYSPIEANMYCAVSGDNAVIVDPNISSELSGVLRGKGVSRVLILLTHEHYDHITGVNYFAEHFSSTVVCSRACAEFIAKPQNNRAELFAALMKDVSREELTAFMRTAPTRFACGSDITFEDSIEFSWHGFPVAMKSAPGHSRGSCLISVGNMLFTGDLWIAGKKVITNMRGGSREDYENITLPMLRDVADGTLIMPGHGKPFIKEHGQPAES
ncbi:MAG: MBL fold metallo-hydrolase [Oscillospiraceae bacterium]